MSPFEVTIEAAAFLSGELSSSTVVKNGFGNLRQSEFERKYLDFFPLSLSLSLLSRFRINWESGPNPINIIFSISLFYTGVKNSD